MNITTPDDTAAALARWQPNFGYLSAALKDWPSRRPLRIAVMGDFGAKAAKGLCQTGPALAQTARPLAVEFDSLDRALARVAPSLSLPLGPQGSTIDIRFGALDDFHPDALFDRLEIFRALAGVRQRLLSPTGFAAAAAELMQGSSGLPLPGGQPAAAAGWAPRMSDIGSRELSGVMTSPLPSGEPVLRPFMPGSITPPGPLRGLKVSLRRLSWAGWDIIYSATGAITSTLRPMPTKAMSLRDRFLSLSIMLPVARENIGVLPKADVFLKGEAVPGITGAPFLSSSSL